MGLNSVGIRIGCKTRTKENKSEQLGTKERKNKIKNKRLFDNVEHKAGKNITVDEEADEFSLNSFLITLEWNINNFDKSNTAYPM
ncbi:hypothetical protein BDFB_014250 [Asbolus verrucosus]|uniref:Uncharacterized protein n=1 Tax=Asbolus verrucosus TaxID=1661398 RepID=A0A482V9B6_ASBVE|nr:hypothetical protein BDFB_014250 [Asbolus verrucosus]